jgi:amino acid transporter
MGDALSQLISGALVMGYFVAGLYFLRFWRDTRDRLFGIFAAAFWLLAAQRAALALTVDPTGEQVVLYSVRLLAFVLILAAIIDKNRGGD